MALLLFLLFALLGSAVSDHDHAIHINNELILKTATEVWKTNFEGYLNLIRLMRSRVFELDSQV
jgi:hypothetical protein